jgi:hypothetical protein
VQVVVRHGMPAPPEVVFNTATDPNRADAWLPGPIRAAGLERPTAMRDGPSEVLSAEWTTGDTVSASIEVRPDPAGGADVALGLSGSEPGLTELAERSLADLAREVDENLTPG